MATNCNLPPGGSGLVRKPDLALFDIDQSTASEWGCTHAIAEITNMELQGRIRDMICQKALIIFKMQSHQQFVSSIGIAHDHVRLYLHDRAGEIITERNIQRDEGGDGGACLIPSWAHAIRQGASRI